MIVLTTSSEALTHSVLVQLVCLGVLASGRSDLEFSVAGTVAALMWLPVAAVYKVQW